MSELTIFAQRLKLARERCGMKQKELAERVALTPQTISAYEKAEVDGKGKNPTLENAVEIAKALNTSLDWLCGFDLTQSNHRRDITLGDYARMFAEMISWPTTAFSEITEMITVHYNGADIYDIRSEEVPETYPAIAFKSGIMRKFVEDMRKMHDLLTSQTIDSGLYERWLNDRVRLMDRFSPQSQKQQADSDKGFVELDDPDELPF